MTTAKINDSRLIELVDKLGMSQSDAARALGVSRQAVSKRLKEMRGKTTRVLCVSKRAERAVDQKLDAMAQLTKINAYANELLEKLMQWSRGDTEALQAILSQKEVGSKEETDPQDIRLKDPRELALKAMAEIRGQLKLQLEIYQSLYDMKAMAEFQEVVLDTIGEVSPNVRERILYELNQKRAVRSIVNFR